MFSTKEIREELRACTLKIPCRSAKHKASACITKALIPLRKEDDREHRIVYSTSKRRILVR